MILLILIRRILGISLQSLSTLSLLLLQVGKNGYSVMIDVASRILASPSSPITDYALAFSHTAAATARVMSAA